MVEEGMVREAGLTDEGMSLESEMINKGSAINARLTD